MKRISAPKRTDTIQEIYKRANKGQVKVYFEHEYIQTEDEKFLIGLVEYIKKNISNPNLSVETTSHDMNMSRIWLYKKLLMLTGKSPVEFIRAIRLQKAVQLLENTQMRISEVASEAGFETPHYFSRIFKKEYDMLPSTYVRFARKAKAEVVLNGMGLPIRLK